MKKIALNIIVIGTTLAIVSNAQTVNDTAHKKKYEYIYGVDMEYTLEGYHRIVNEYIIDSVEITETDTLNIK